MIVGIDFDGTLAHYDGWKGYKHLGAPVEGMLDKVRQLMAAGHQIVIFTARISNIGSDQYGHVNVEHAVSLIQDWTEHYLGVRFPVTNVKTGFVFFDDNAIQVKANTGKPVLDCIQEEIDNIDTQAAIDGNFQMREAMRHLSEYVESLKIGPR